MAENAKQLAELQGPEKFLRKHSTAFVLGFPEDVASKVERPVLDRFPGVHCNEAVVAYIKKNPGALLEAFREVCRSSKSGGGAPPQQPRVELLPDNKYTEYEAHFQRFLDEPQPLVVVEADGAEASGYTPQPLLARYAGKYDLVYRVAFPKGCPLQVRKEIMAELYFKHVHVDPEHCLAEYQSDNKQHKDAVTRMRWCPLREITVGKQLLRHSVSVSSLRSSLQPTHGIFAWDATAICNLDDVHQAVGRINGKRYHRLHLEACYPGKATMKERRPQLCIAEGFYNMVAGFAAAMEALKNKFPNAKLSPNGLSPNDNAGFLGYASAAGHGELQNGETEAMFGKPGIKGPKTHVTQARIIRSLTDEAFGRGGTARATMPDGLTELGKFLALTADGDASDSDSESGQENEDDEEYDEYEPYSEGDVVTGRNFKTWMASVLPRGTAENDTNQGSVRAAVHWAEEADLELYTPADVAVALDACDRKNEAKSFQEVANPLASRLLKAKGEPRFGNASQGKQSVARWALWAWLDEKFPQENKRSGIRSSARSSTSTSGPSTARRSTAPTATCGGSSSPTGASVWGTMLTPPRGPASPKRSSSRIGKSRGAALRAATRTAPTSASARSTPTAAPLPWTACAAKKSRETASTAGFTPARATAARTVPSAPARHCASSTTRSKSARARAAASAASPHRPSAATARPRPSVLRPTAAASRATRRLRRKTSNQGVGSDERRARRSKIIRPRSAQAANPSERVMTEIGRAGRRFIRSTEGISGKAVVDITCRFVFCGLPGSARLLVARPRRTASTGARPQEARGARDMRRAGSPAAAAQQQQQQQLSFALRRGTIAQATTHALDAYACPVRRRGRAPCPQQTTGVLGLLDSLILIFLPSTMTL